MWLMLLLAPLWLIVLLISLLWLTIFFAQQRFLPCVLLHYLCLHKNDAFQFRLPSILQCTLNLICIRSIDVAYGLVCSFSCQRRLLLHKNSITYVPVIFMSWIIICANYIFSLYAFPFAHFWRWWTRQRPYNQQLNIQHSFFFSFQLFFYFCSSQQFHFLLPPSFVFTPMRFLFPCYSL